MALPMPAPTKLGSTKFSVAVANWTLGSWNQYPRTRYSLISGRSSHDDEFAISSRGPGRARRRIPASLDLIVRPQMIGGALRFLGIYLALSLVYGALLLLQILPVHPRSVLGWGILFALAVPVALVGELVGDILFRNPIARAVEKRTRGTKLSWARIGYALVAVISAITLAWFALLFFARMVL
jgi:hypothetical protein